MAVRADTNTGLGIKASRIVIAALLVAPWGAACSGSIRAGFSDAPPTVAFTAATQIVDENAGTVTVTVALSAASGMLVSVPFTVGGTASRLAAHGERNERPTRVPFTVGGTASRLEDHNLTNGNILIAAGATTGSVTFKVVDEALDELDETVVLTLATPTNATLGAIMVHAVTIADNDVAEIAAGGQHTCARLKAGRIRCWGQNGHGQLGYGNTNNIGDNEGEMPPHDVNVGGTVIQIAAGSEHTCALLSTGRVRCWGSNWAGQLGYGHENDIGDNQGEMPPPDVSLNLGVGERVVQISTGLNHTCARLSTGNVRCWGRGDHGALGYENPNYIGDDETPYSVGNVNVGGEVIHISPGAFHTCALVSTRKVRCWGRSNLGDLGYGTQYSRGDDPGEMPTPDVPLW